MPSGGASSFTPGSSRGRTRAPEGTGDAGFCVRRAGKDEEKIGKAVEIDRHKGVRVRHRQYRTLGPAADRARKEQSRSAFVPARKNEALQVWQRRVRLLDVVFQPLDRVVRDA